MVENSPRVHKPLHQFHTHTHTHLVLTPRNLIVLTLPDRSIE